MARDRVAVRRGCQRPRLHTRLTETGDVVLQFGDGVHGARLPSGSANVNAKYRTGTGLAGMLAAGQINLLMTRPLA